MSAAKWALVAAIVATGALLASCGSDDPQSPPAVSSVSGTVVFASTGAPASGVDVTMEQCVGDDVMGGGMMDDGHMMHDDWDHDRHTMTDHDGNFHFEYMHDGGHRYRVRADGMNPDGMCYLEGGVEDGIELRIENQ